MQISNGERNLHTTRVMGFRFPQYNGFDDLVRSGLNEKLEHRQAVLVSRESGRRHLKKHRQAVLVSRESERRHLKNADRPCWSHGACGPRHIKNAVARFPGE